METLAKSDAITQDDKELLDEVKQLVQKHIPAATILLYGSVARGTQGPDSDYDILILSDEPASRSSTEHIGDALYDLELARGIIIAAMFRSTDQWEAPAMQASPFHKEVSRDAVLL